MLVALRFFATGSYQEIVGSHIFTAICQPITSQCIQEVTDALYQQSTLNAWIKFPSSIQELEALRTRFYEKHQFLGTIGIIDCTYVAIVMPSRNQCPENTYGNRKNYHSINVQLESKGRNTAKLLRGNYDWTYQHSIPVLIFTVHGENGTHFLYNRF
nr:unnamed protein product [Callosobruchus analis]